MYRERQGLGDSGAACTRWQDTAEAPAEEWFPHSLGTGEGSHQEGGRHPGLWVLHPEAGHTGGIGKTVFGAVSPHLESHGSLAEQSAGEQWLCAQPAAQD